MQQSDDKENSKINSIKIVVVYKKLLSIAMRKYPLFFVFEIVKTVLEFINPFILIWCSPLLIDEIIGTRELSKIGWYLLVILGGGFLIKLGIGLTNAKLAMYQNRLDDYFQIVLGKHIMSLDYQMTEDKKVLDQLEKARNGISWYSGGVFGLTDELFRLVGSIMKIFGYVAIILIYTPYVLPVIVIYIILQAYINKKINNIEIQTYSNLSVMDRLFKYYGFNICDFQYGKDIRLYDAKEMVIERWGKNADETVGIWKEQATNQLPYVVFRDVLSNIRNLITYLYVGFLLVNRSITVGTFTQLIAAANGLDNALGSCVFCVQEIIKKTDYAYQFVLFMDYPEDLKKGQLHVPLGEHTIEFDNVSFTYPGSQKTILKNVSVTISSKEHLAIVGLNGAGKTTFIKLLCRLYDPTSGTIKLDGVDIKDYDYNEYLSQFAPVFQDFKLFSFSIGENIHLSNHDTRISHELLKRVGLDDFIESLPQKVNTILFKYFREDGITPSGGEQQKIAIARALFKKSSIVVLDEPTSALDPVAEYEIYTRFNELVKDNMALFISHRMSSCRFCDHIVVFDDGMIKEYGTHEELIKIKNGLYANMFENQAQYYRSE